MDKKRMSKSDRFLNIHYTLAMGTYWFLTAVLSVFLIPLEKAQGYEMGQIAIFIAGRAIAGMLVQPLLASFAQRHVQTISLQAILSVLCLVAMGTTVFHILAKPVFLLTLLIFILYGCTLSTLSTFLDALTNQYALGGRTVNYTLARTFGSITWAVAALYLGRKIDFGSRAYLVLVVQAVSLLVLFLLVITMERPAVKDVSVQKKNRSSSFGKIMKDNPEFTLLLFVYLTVMLTMNINMSYLSEKISMLGGDTANLGLAQFILAISEVFVPLFFEKVRRRFGVTRVLMIALSACAARVLLVSLAVSMPMVYIGQMTEALVALYYTGNVTYIREKIRPEDQITAQGLLAGFQTAAGCIGSILAARLIVSVGASGLFKTISIIAVFGLVVMYAGMFFLHRSMNRKQPAAAECMEG